MMAELIEEVIEEPPSYGGDVLIGSPSNLAARTAARTAAAIAAAGTGITLPAAAMQFADLTESGSESGTNGEPEPEEQPEQDNNTGTATPNTPSTRPVSPPPNCAICLSRCRRKCFTDSCMHQFCFKCLCEWSKIKPECPLCKQPFKTIIHNVRTLDDYDRYPVQTSTQEHSAVSFHIVNIRRQHFRLQNQAVMTNDLDAAATDESQDGGTLSRMQPPVSRFEPYRMELLNFYRHDPDAGGPAALSHLWRRYVYDRKLYALPVSDSLTGNFREWSARFYRNNPAQMHRLMPWINRDVACLMRNSPQNVSEVMQLMHDILPMINIPTRTFRRRLSPFLGERTNHFIHELFNFARSPYDMIGYDRVVQYSARVGEEVEVDLLDLVSNNDAGNPADPESNVNGNAAANGNVNEPIGSAAPASDWSRLPRPSTSVIVTNPSATHSFSVTMATDGSELPGISIRRTTTSNVGSQTVAINLSMRRPTNEVIEIDDGDAAANAEVAAINDGNNQTGRRQAGASLPISAHVDLQSSDCSNSSDEDDDECVFVLERKPPHLRTPELVSLDSNSDSDVVFVDEQKLSTPLKAGAGSNASLEQKNEEGSVAASASSAMGLFMGPSTSTGVCSASGKSWKMVLAEARRGDLLQQRSGRPKRNLARARFIPTALSNKSSNSSDTSYSTDSDSSSHSDDSYMKTSRRKRRATRKPKTRKRPSQSKPTAQRKSKRRRKQPSEPEVEAELEPQLERSKSSSSSSSSSCEGSDEGARGNSSEAETAENVKTYNSSSNSNSNSSDDDSKENLKLSMLRDTLKVESTAQHSKKQSLLEHKLSVEQMQQALKHKSSTEQLAERAQQPETETVVSRALKRTLSCNSSNSSSNLSTRSTSTLPSMSSCSALSIFNNNTVEPAQSLSMVHDIANSLIELSTLNVENAGADSLFNEESESVPDAMSFLHGALPSVNPLNEDAQLGIYSDNELRHYQAIPEPEMALYVVGEANSEQEESIDVTDQQQPEQQLDEPFEEQDEQELAHNQAENQATDQAQQLEQQQEQEDDNDEDYDDEDNDNDNDNENDNEDDGNDNDAAAADSEPTDSDQDTTEAY